MSLIHGFRILEQRKANEVGGTITHFRHEQSGAELLSICNKDENKVFGITFRTPPADSTGIAHIMEHSVLCGSEKYPTKEPFVELLKCSLKTFLNAFTYPDKTCYPVASQNVKDFYNLIDVYLDAVFHPRITPEVLQQEGWHYELEDKDAPLTYKGVVYNEMKGVYSSPDSLLSEYAHQSLFPGHTYGNDSGGHPDAIPNLTYEDFKAFHKNHYHPSNSRIFFYGNDNEEKRLEYLNNILSGFQVKDVSSSVPLMKRKNTPAGITKPYAVTEAQKETAKGHISCNWLLEDVLNVEKTIELSLLSHILTGIDASPLRKALNDSGLGEDVFGGLETELRQLYYSVGLKGVEEKNLSAVEKLIFKTLEEISEKGIDPKSIDSALNTLEFRLREQNTGRFPRGISMMLRSLTHWLYDGNPIDVLCFEKPLEAVKKKIAANPRFFEEYIKTSLLENKHRTTLQLIPDPQLTARQEEELKEKLQAVKEKMSEEELEETIRKTRHLKKLQETPDSPEDIAKIPVLSVADLEKLSTKLPQEETTLCDIPVFMHKHPTNGIAYCRVGLSLQSLPVELLPYLSLYAESLTALGTTEEDFVSLSQRISSKTGGIHCSFLHSEHATEKKSLHWFFLKGKVMTSQKEELVKLFSDILQKVNFDNTERLRQLLLEEKAGMESALVPSGHMIADQRLRSSFSTSGAVSEITGGLEYLFFLRNLAEEGEKGINKLIEQLQAIHAILTKRSEALFSFTAEEEEAERILPLLEPIAHFLASEKKKEEKWSFPLQQASEGVIIPSQVQYVAKGASLYRGGYEYHGSAQVVLKYLNTSYLWEKVRVQGGAYGGFCRFNRRTGVFSYLSYRDPNLEKTIEVYDKTAAFLKQNLPTQEEIDKSIIGTIGEIDGYMLPDAKGATALTRHLIGITDEERQKTRNEVLTTTRQDFLHFAEALETVAQEGRIVALGSQEVFKRAEKAEGFPSLKLIQAL